MSFRNTSIHVGAFMSIPCSWSLLAGVTELVSIEECSVWRTHSAASSRSGSEVGTIVPKSFTTRESCPQTLEACSGLVGSASPNGDSVGGTIVPVVGSLEMSKSAVTSSSESPEFCMSPNPISMSSKSRRSGEDGTSQTSS